MTAQMRQWLSEVATYAHEARRPRDFVRIMRVRLSQSKVGWLVCSNPIVVEVDMASLGRGVTLRSHTTDISVLGELLVSDAYGAVPSPGDQQIGAVIDLGANIGLTARWMASRWPGARLLCVEPEAGNAAVLRNNVAQLGDVHVVQACVGACERNVKLATTSGEHGFRMSEEGWGADVDVVTMDSLLASAGIDRVDVLKCDIEGAEKELFEFCASWIGRVGTAVVECHDDFGTEDLVALVSANGGHFEVIDRQPNPAYGCETVTLRNCA